MNICLINNYNYGHFLEQALLSALNQTKQFDLIIVVDDGSTDGSRIILNEYKTRDNILILEKDNGGQLSTFNAATPYIPVKSRVYFLDSDDLYPTNYLDSIITALGTNKDMADFVYCDKHQFSNESQIKKSASDINPIRTVIYPCTSALTRKYGLWIGNVTSTLSISGDLFHKLLPCHLESDWRSRADDVLVYGASIAGMQKTHLQGISINYRVHDTNTFFNRDFTIAQRLKHRVTVERLFNWLAVKFGLQITPPQKNIRQELKAFPHGYLHTFGLKKRYFLALLFGV